MNRETAAWLKLLIACAIGVVIVLAFAERIDAAELDIGIGQTKFRAREDGTWFQSQYETHNDLKSGSWRIAVRDHFPRSRHFGWSIGYSDLGSFSGNNHASVWDDEAGRIPEDGSACSMENKSHGCLAWFRGTGKAKGMTLGLTADQRIGPVTVGAELGAFFFRSHYDVTIEFNQGMNFMDSRGEFAPGSSYEYNHATGTQRTWYYGYRASYGRFYVEVLRFFNVYEQGRGPGGDVGLTGGATIQATAGISIPF
jgi:hypothetical protein